MRLRLRQTYESVDYSVDSGRFEGEFLSDFPVDLPSTLRLVYEPSYLHPSLVWRLS
jgi:hypothetical protein